MTDMIEKLARAINPHCWADDLGTDMLEVYEAMRSNARDKAREVLTALRTPTNEMIEAGVNRGRRDDLHTDVEHCFQVMVDKALGRVDLPVGEEQQA